jgi:glyoxylase-like metal-dependent hydrolase (beta-lactamase superfamily II)
MDRKFVTRPDPAITFWKGDQFELTEGVTLIRCGGHFPGSTVLHWAHGAEGKGVLLTGDTLQLRADNGLSFMHSYPNLIPLDATKVGRIAASLDCWPFETVYGGWRDKVIRAGAKQVMAASVQQYINAVTGSH